MDLRVIPCEWKKISALCFLKSLMNQFRLDMIIGTGKMGKLRYILYYERVMFKLLIL